TKVVALVAPMAPPTAAPPTAAATATAVPATAPPTAPGPVQDPQGLEQASYVQTPLTLSIADDLGVASAPGLLVF
ncbi:hypothetical protein BASA62_003232, partial [Batrachochytrium salamandrivorans]